MARFTAMPEAPSVGLSPAEAVFSATAKQNIELLIGSRGEPGLGSKAVTRGDISVKQLGNQQMQTVGAKSSGFTISGSDVAGLADYGLLVADVQTLANDLARTRLALDTLIRNITGA